MQRNKIVLVLIVVAVSALIGFKLSSNKKVITERAEAAIASQQFDVSPVRTSAAAKKNIENSLAESGTFAAHQELKLSAQAQGQITRLLVKKSQNVQKGTLLAIIDNSSLSSQLSSTEAALEKSKTDVQRLENALASGGVSQQQVEDARLKVQNLEAQIAQIKQQGRNYRLVAPMSGVINNLFVEEGSFVSAGTQILEIVDLSQVSLTVRLDQKHITDIKIGKKVSITSDVYPDKIFPGRIETMNVKTDLSQKIEVGVSMPNSKEFPILAGMYGRAQFADDKGKKQETVLIIPRAAVTGSIQDAKVWVVNMTDNTVTSKAVTVGRTFDNEVEILKGINEGEQVVTAGQINLEPGKKVVVKN